MPLDRGEGGYPTDVPQFHFGNDEKIESEFFEFCSSPLPAGWEQADQSCQDSSRIRAIKAVEQLAYLLMYLLMYLLGGTLGHDDDLSKPATPNQFGKRRIDAGRSRQSAPFVTLKSGTTERFLGRLKIG